MSIRIIGMDIPTQLENLLRQQEKNARETVFIEDMVAYRKGVEDTISMLKELLAPIGKDYIVQNEDVVGGQIEIPLNEVIALLQNASAETAMLDFINS